MTGGRCQAKVWDHTGFHKIGCAREASKVVHADDHSFDLCWQHARIVENGERWDLRRLGLVEVPS